MQMEISNSHFNYCFFSDLSSIFRNQTGCPSASRAMYPYRRAIGAPALISSPAVVKDVLKPHVDGLPAVNLHCAMHSYRTGNHKKRVEKLGGDGSLWFEYLGLQSSAHDRKTPIAISFTDKQGKDDAVVVWTNFHGEKKTRVFRTTIGHNNETVQDARYLDLVAKGCLWACGKLDAEGKAAAGYGKVMK
jgi:hypothetical protein